MSKIPGLLICSLLLITSGCREPEPPPKVTVAPSIEPRKDCNQSIGSLKSVKSIDINNKTVTESGEVTAGNDTGYTFIGKAGQVFNYSSSDKICLVIFNPALEPLKTTKLPTNGQYTVQIFVPRGSEKYKLILGLETLELSQQKAEEILQGWLNAKSKVFRTPFERSPVDQFTTGVYNRNITKTGGSIDWLKSNNAYWEYKDSKIKQTFSFSSNESQAQLKVQIYEDRILHYPGGTDYEKSGQFTEIYTYTLIKENKNWKIAQSKGD